MFAKGEVLQKAGGPLFGGNVFIRKSVFEAVGGFDEAIVSHGGEDCLLGLTLEEAGYTFIYSDKVCGWHLYHKRNQAENRKSLIRNVDYIDRKFKKGKYSEN